MLVTAAQLAGHLNDPAYVIFDCRHDLGDTAKGARLYAEGHVAGAHFASVDADLSGAKTGKNGRHPLPSAAAFAAFLARHGVTDTTTIVGYDDAGGMYAARLWWMARWIGLSNVSILDGGWQKWVAEGWPVSAVAPPKPAMPSGLVAKPDNTKLWTADEVLARIGKSDSAIIDARAAERYRGDVEPIDPVAGHIPGALNRFYKTNLKSDLTLRPAAELRSEFAALLGARRPENVGHQCGSGITACANIFAMEYAGLTGSKLYGGSWSEWVSDPTRPVAKG